MRLELLNRSEGDVTSIIAGMDDTVGDDDLKEEIMRCFSNAPTMIQAIRVLRGIRQCQNEQAYLYAARYEFIHIRAHNMQPEEQTQISELIHYASTLLPHLQRKLLKKLNSFYQPKSLRVLYSSLSFLVSVDSFLYTQLILYANNTELILLCI